MMPSYREALDKASNEKAGGRDLLKTLFMIAPKVGAVIRVAYTRFRNAALALFSR
jgi:hypothetical protein